LTAIRIDTPAIQVDRSGVRDYYWPVRQQELIEGAQAILQTFASVLRDLLARGEPDAHIAAVASNIMVSDTIAIFAARLLATRLDAAGKTLPSEALGDAALWRCAMLGEQYSGSFALSLLRKGLSRPPSWRRLIRPFADLVSQVGFPRGPIEWVDFDESIVAVTVCPLSRKRAERLKARVYYTPLYEWFYTPSQEELSSSPPRPISPDLRDRLVAPLENLFVRLGANPARMPPGTFHELFDGVTSWIQFYLRRIQSRPDRLPKQLWKGSSGIIWARILAEAVRMNGGTVTGFDHGYGANFSELSHFPFVELQGNDVFVTYTEAHADLFRRVGPKLTFESRVPAVECESTARAAEPSPPVVDRTPQTVLYVAPFLSYGRVSSMPLMPPVMALDWQARLLSMLSDIGLSVSQKPHPEAPVSTASILESLVGVTTSNERFEKVMNDYDVLLFDFAPQTCFGAAMRSNRPVVLIDFGVTTYEPRYFDMLKARCAVVKGWFDQDNRAQVDRDELRAAVEQARFLNDPSFARDVIAL